MCKFGKEKDEDEVCIFMAVWRIAGASSPLPCPAALFRVDRAHLLSRQDADPPRPPALPRPRAGKNTDVVLTVNCPQPALERFASETFARAVGGFRVEDWGLFAG